MSYQLHVPTTLISDLAKNLLSTAEQVLIDNGLRLPSHRFTSFHQPAWDCCDHLVVHVASIKPARATRRTRSSARSDTGGISMHETDIVLTYVGCAATGDPIPTDALIDANAVNTHTYAWTLYQGLVCNFGGSSLDGPFGEGCKLVKVSSLQPHPPMGGCESFTITFTVQLS